MKLKINFYTDETISVARKLLGKTLVRVTSTGTRLSGKIIETEAYIGAKDPACHTFGYKKTDRTRTMFLEGGRAYIYLIYGMYNCFNVVTSLEGEPEAVLVRALEPLEGVPEIGLNRKKSKIKDLLSGPGKICMGLNIDRRQDGLSLDGEELFIEDGPPLSDHEIMASPRVGIDYAGDAVEWPLRFTIWGHPLVSPPKPL